MSLRVMLAVAIVSCSCGSKGSSSRVEEPTAREKAAAAKPAPEIPAGSILARAIAIGDSVVVPSLETAALGSVKAMKLADVACVHARAGDASRVLELASDIAGTGDWTASQSLARVAGACISAGDADLAEDVIDKIEDGSERAGALVSLAEHLIDAGKTEEAREVLDKALSTVDDIEPESYDVLEGPGTDSRIWVSDCAPAFGMIVEIAAAHARAGDVETARNLASSMEQHGKEHFWKGSMSGWEAETLLAILDARPEEAAEILPSARKAAESIVIERMGDAEKKVSLLLDIARKLEKTEGVPELIDEALEASKSMETVDVAEIRVSMGVEGLARIADACVELGYEDRARKVLERALELVQADKKSKMSQRERELAVALTRIAAVQGAMGHADKAKPLIDEADGLIAKIEDPCWKAQALGDIVGIHLDHGSTSMAARKAEAQQATLSSEISSCWVGDGEGLVSVVEALISSSRLDEAATVAAKLDPGWYGVEALTALASAHAAAGETERAGQLVREALGIVSKKDDTWDRELLHIAGLYPLAAEQADPDTLALLDAISAKRD